MQNSQYNHFGGGENRWTDREIMDYEMIQQHTAFIGIVARGLYLQEGADTPNSENCNVYDLQSTSQLQKQWYRLAAWGGYLALPRLSNATKENRCKTTINHNRATVGGGGMGGVGVIIMQMLHLVVLIVLRTKKYGQTDNG